MNNKCLRTFSLCVFLLTTVSVFGQKKSQAKYPSLLWEITGNGLKKPSYLFGTMHVSSKMVFHLSDSFYNAIKSVDAVALELNPDLWQNQMVQLDKMKNNYSEFTRQPVGDYLTESSFRIEKYDDMLQMAMSTEPVVVNNLLYRSYESKENFEEDTFLDLYIFQTAKKLGKRTTGVENYYEAERLVMEAYADMSNEKKRKTVDTDGESMYDIQEKMQSAYRRGDLDLMDSLDIMVETSDAFREKFLYKRTEIQANSIDTILQKSSLFVGVGAAHLPGKRGIIELLRKKGYTLRPIKIIDRDATDKESIDKMKVPVIFSKIKSEDGFYSVDVPGPLYKMSDDGKYIDRMQYSDMSNGSYYLVTRVKTHSSFVGQSEETVLKKIDSLLYENIPGKILSKKIITRNGYSGYDITNKTRRGNLQRFNIFVTPYEIIIFKMSGNETYIQGTEGERFFSSIQLRESISGSTVFSPQQGGFTIKFPQTPSQTLDNNTSDNMSRWEYEAVDKTNGDDYLVFNKNVYNFKFLDEDTFDLKLIEESFRSPDYFERQLSRQPSSFFGYPCLDVKEMLKDSSVITAHYIIKGPHYYIVAVRSKDPTKDFSNYFNSFQFTPYHYPKSVAYVDTFLNYAVTTPVVPQLDEHYRATLDKMTSSSMYGYFTDYYSSSYEYWPKEKNASFQNDSTGEAVWISIQQYPHYYYKGDSTDFWKPEEISNYYERKSFQLYSKNFIRLNDGSLALDYSLRDTGSSRVINHLITLKNDYLFNMVTLSDTLSKPDEFIGTFWKTFTPQLTHSGRNIFNKCVDSFFNDLYSKDSTTHAKAVQAIDNVYFNEDDVPKLVDAINRENIADKDYYDIKKELIEQLGYVNDSTKAVVVSTLKKIYEHTADTSTFQNAALRALSKHKTKDAMLLFKQLILQDPPVFDNSNEYTTLFSGLSDSLELAAPLFPDILQLTALDDYKEPVTSLLVTLVDSGLVKTKQYEDYFDKIYFDAKIKLKKEQNEEQKSLEEKKAKEGDDDESSSYYRYSDYDYLGSGKSELDDYAVLLMPFYDKNPNIPKFFDKLLRSTDKNLQLNTITLLLRNNKPAPDSILSALAADDKYRSKLYSELDGIDKLNKFPAKYKNQLDIARSNLLSERSYAKADSIVFISKQPATAYKEKGTVYFFKYRIKKDDDWKIGISGLQPENPDSVSTDEWQSLTTMTDKKLKEDEPIDEQLQKQLKKVLFASHNSGRYFFEGDNSYRFKRIGEY